MCVCVCVKRSQTLARLLPSASEWKDRQVLKNLAFILELSQDTHPYPHPHRLTHRRWHMDSYRRPLSKHSPSANILHLPPALLSNVTLMTGWVRAEKEQPACSDSVYFLTIYSDLCPLRQGLVKGCSVEEIWTWPHATFRPVLPSWEHTAEEGVFFLCLTQTSTSRCNNRGCQPTVLFDSV